MVQVDELTEALENLMHGNILYLREKYVCVWVFYYAIGNAALIQQIVTHNILNAKYTNQNRLGGGSDFPKGVQ